MISKCHLYTFFYAKKLMIEIGVIPEKKLKPTFFVFFLTDLKKKA